MVKSKNREDAEDDDKAGQGKYTHDVVVLAADDVRAARVAGADADDVDGRALEADEDVDALDDDAEQAEQEGRDRVSGLETAASDQ